MLRAMDFLANNAHMPSNALTLFTRIRFSAQRCCWPHGGCKLPLRPKRLK